MFDVTHVSSGHRNRYCGPAALSALTGITAEDAARLLRKVTGKRSIKGCPTWGVVNALKEMGLEVKRVRGAKTVGKWRKPAGRYLVVVGGRTNGHFIAVEGSKFWDSGAYGGEEGEPLKRIARKGLRDAFLITGRANKSAVPKPPKKHQARTTSARNEAKSLMTALNVRCSDFGDGEIELYAPDGHTFTAMGEEMHSYIAYYMPGEKVDAWKDVVDTLKMGVEPCECDDCKAEAEEKRVEGLPPEEKAALLAAKVNHAIAEGQTVTLQGRNGEITLDKVRHLDGAHGLIGCWTNERGQYCEMSPVREEDLVFEDLCAATGLPLTKEQRDTHKAMKKVKAAIDAGREVRFCRDPREPTELVVDVHWNSTYISAQLEPVNGRGRGITARVQQFLVRLPNGKLDPIHPWKI
jgi:hypothetical protein